MGLSMSTLATFQERRLALRFAGIGLYWASCLAFGILFSYIRWPEWIVIVPVITGAVGLAIAFVSALLYLPNVLAFFLGLLYLVGVFFVGAIVVFAFVENAIN